MTVKEQLSVIHNSYRCLIMKDGELLYNDWVGARTIAGEILAAEVKQLVFRPEIRHKQWKERQLMPPLNPEETPAYSFSDLELRLYYEIHI